LVVVDTFGVLNSDLSIIAVDEGGGGGGGVSRFIADFAGTFGTLAVRICLGFSLAVLTFVLTADFLSSEVSSNSADWSLSVFRSNDGSTPTSTSRGLIDDDGGVTVGATLISAVDSSLVAFLVAEMAVALETASPPEPGERNLKILGLFAVRRFGINNRLLRKIGLRLGWFNGNVCLKLVFELPYIALILTTISGTTLLLPIWTVCCAEIGCANKKIPTVNNITKQISWVCWVTNAVSDLDFKLLTIGVRETPFL